MRILNELGTALSANRKVAGYGREDDNMCQLKSKLPTGDILSVVQNGSGDIDIMVYQPDPWDAPYQNLSLDSSKITKEDIPAIVELIDHYVADYQKYRNYKLNTTRLICKGVGYEQQHKYTQALPCCKIRKMALGHIRLVI